MPPQQPRQPGRLGQRQEGHSRCIGGQLASRSRDGRQHVSVQSIPVAVSRAHFLTIKQTVCGGAQGDQRSQSVGYRYKDGRGRGTTRDAARSQRDAAVAVRSRRWRDRRSHKHRIHAVQCVAYGLELYIAISTICLQYKRSPSSVTMDRDAPRRTPTHEARVWLLWL